MESIYLVMYDISDDNKRNKAALLLQRYGYERIQYSVFTGLQPPQSNAKLWIDLKKLVNTGEYPGDKLFCIAVGKTHFRNMQVIGDFNADTEYLLGQCHTLIF